MQGVATYATFEQFLADCPPRRVPKITECVNIFELTRWHSDRDWIPLGPCEPTTIRPGPDKVAVLARRMELGVELWHPSDPTCLTQSWLSILHGERIGDFATAPASMQDDEE